MGNLNLGQEPQRKDEHDKPSLTSDNPSETPCHLPSVRVESERQRSLLFSDCIEVICCDRAPTSLRLGSLVSLTVAIAKEPQEYLQALSEELCLEIFDVDLEPRLIDARRDTSIRKTKDEVVFVEAMNEMENKVFQGPYSEHPFGSKMVKMGWVQIIICLNCTTSPVEERAKEIRGLITRKQESDDLITAATLTDDALGEICAFLSDSLVGRKVIVHMFMNLAANDGQKIYVRPVRLAILEGVELCKNKGITDFLLTVRYILDNSYREVDDDIYKAERACLLSLRHDFDSLGEMGQFIGFVGPEEVIKFSTEKYKRLFSFALGVARTLETSVTSCTAGKNKINKLLHQRGVEAAQRRIAETSEGAI